MESPEELLEELAATELSEKEVRAVLERLSADECGLNVRPTIAAVSEATGTPPAVIGRILTDLRHQTLESQYGSIIISHDQRIGALEAKSRDRNEAIRSCADAFDARARRMLLPGYVSTEMLERAHRIFAEQERHSREVKARRRDMAVTLFLVASFVFLVAVLAIQRS